MHTIDMKKLAIFLLTVFTIGAASLCGCNNTMKTKGFDGKIDTESVQIQAINEDEQPSPQCPDGECPDEKLPNDEEKDSKCPLPRKPHKRHGKHLPHPKPTFKR